MLRFCTSPDAYFSTKRLMWKRIWLSLFNNRWCQLEPNSAPCARCIGDVCVTVLGSRENRMDWLLSRFFLFTVEVSSSQNDEQLASPSSSRRCIMWSRRLSDWFEASPSDGSITGAHTQWRVGTGARHRVRPVRPCDITILWSKIVPCASRSHGRRPVIHERS